MIFETWLDAVWAALANLRKETARAGYYERVYANKLGVYVDPETPGGQWLVAWIGAPRGHQVNSGWQPFDPPWMGQEPQHAAERLMRAMEQIESSVIYQTFAPKISPKQVDE